MRAVDLSWRYRLRGRLDLPGGGSFTESAGWAVRSAGPRVIDVIFFLDLIDW